MTAAVTIIKLDYTGRELFTYSGTLEYSDQDTVIARCRWDRLPPLTVGLLRFETGDVFLEYYYRRYWFNIDKVFSAQGTLKGWYCNVAETMEMSTKLVRWRDLALDLVMLPDGRQSALDEDEFAVLPLDIAQRTRALAAWDELRAWVFQRKAPFDDAAQLS